MTQAHADLSEELDAFIADEDVLFDDDYAPPPPPATNIEEANRLLRVRRRYESQIDEINRIAEDEIDRIKFWQNERRAVVVRKLNHLDGVLETYARAEAAATGRKTLKLPNGTLRLTAPREKVEIVDDTLFVAWALANHADADLVRVTYEAAKTNVAKLTRRADVVLNDGEHVAYAAVIEETDEPVPGVQLVIAHQPSFSINSSN